MEIQKKGEISFSLQGCRQLGGEGGVGGGGGANKVKTKELQFSSRGRVGSKNFLQNPRSVREQIRV